MDEAELIQYEYVASNLENDVVESCFLAPIRKAGYYTIPGSCVCIGEPLSAYSPKGVVLSLYEKIEPIEDSGNTYKMLIVTNFPKSSSADEAITRLLLQLPMFKLLNEIKIKISSG